MAAHRHINLQQGSTSPASATRSIDPCADLKGADLSLNSHRQLSCAECRRLKRRCDRQWPCQSCINRGCASICPDGTLASRGTTSKVALQAAEELQRMIKAMSERIETLEQALKDYWSGKGTHPLLSEELLKIKTPPESVLRSAQMSQSDTDLSNSLRDDPNVLSSGPASRDASPTSATSFPMSSTDYETARPYNTDAMDVVGLELGLGNPSPPLSARRHGRNASIDSASSSSSFDFISLTHVPVASDHTYAPPNSHTFSSPKNQTHTTTDITHLIAAANLTLMASNNQSPIRLGTQGTASASMQFDPHAGTILDPYIYSEIDNSLIMSHDYRHVPTHGHQYRNNQYPPGTPAAQLTTHWSVINPVQYATSVAM